MSNLLKIIESDNKISDIDEAWIDEAERRYKKYKEGKITGIDAQTVFNEADRMLRIHDP